MHICVYLAQRYAPDSNWLPPSPVVTAELQRWFSLATGWLASGPAGARLAALVGQPVEKRCLDQGRCPFGFMEAELAGRDWLPVGATPSLADVGLYSYSYSSQARLGWAAWPWIPIRASVPGWPGSRRCRAYPLPEPFVMDAPSAFFHAGEQALQARVGLHGRMAEVGPVVLRNHMPDQHRKLFEKLPSLLLAVAPDADDPALAALASGAQVGVPGLESHTRRRNRMNGRVRAFDARPGAGSRTDLRQLPQIHPGAPSRAAAAGLAGPGAGRRRPRADRAQ